jgi:transcription elongation GreA/GreB family factor
VSRAFVKDDDDRPEPTILSARAPYYVLVAALAQLDDERRERAVVVEVAPGVAGFGSRIEVIDERGARASYAIVNDEDADPAAGAIGISSPLAQALTGARAGSTVVWHRPIGDATLQVAKVDP